MANQKLEDFKKELKVLLEKYDATIGCDIFEGDSYGKMIVEIDKKDYDLCYGNYLDKSDLK